MSQNKDVQHHEEKRSAGMRAVRFGWIVFAFVMLFNPNIHLIDVLPDFIGYFILAKAIERAADAAPYFEEARRAFLRLGYISLAKIPVLMIVAFVRSGNVQDNDIVTLTALVFATLEIMYLIPAIKNIFDALSYLGERGDVPSLIRNDSLVSTDTLRSFTFAFAIFKTVLYTLPEFLKLTKSVEIGSGLSMISSSRYYPFALLASLTLGLVLGTIWLCRMIIYVNRIKNEGKLYGALREIANVNSYEEYEKKVYYRFVNRTFSLFILSAVFSLDLTFSDYNDVNLLPSFISGILFTFGLLRLIRCTKSKRLTLYTVIASVLYNVSAFVKYVFEIKYLDKFSYADLFRNYSQTANREYAKIQISAIFEVIFYIALMVIFFIAMKRYTDTKLGKWQEDSNPSIKSQYYKEINVKTVILTVIGTVVGILSFANVFIQGSVQIIFTDSSNVTRPTLFVPSLPWFGLVMTVLSVAYAFYSLYYFNFIKDEERT